MKFCESVDPSWDIQSAVWSDDRTELSVKGPQVLKAKRKMGPRNPRKKKELDIDLKMGDMPPEEEQYSVEIDHELSNIINDDQPEQCDMSKLSSTSEDDNLQVSHDTCISDEAQDHNETLAKHISDHGQPIISVEVPHTPPPPDESQKDELSSAIGENQIENSKLQCGTCGVPFRGISNLIKHLKTVHNTSLGQTDISYTFVEEDTGTEREHLLTKRVNSEASKVEEVVELISGEGAIKQEDSDHIKVVIYDDKDKCVDDPMKKAYACAMCHNGFETKRELDSHMTHHTDEEVECAGLHRCDTCNAVMKNTQQISKHILKFHGVTHLCVCSICHKEFYQMSSVKRHMKFFHKWEMKIRGEQSIPTLTKVAPLSLQIPQAVPKARGRRVSQKPSMKMINNGEEEVPLISLEVGDLEHLHIFRSSDGKRMSYDIVKSSDKVKTLKIKEEEIDAEDLIELSDVGAAEEVQEEIVFGEAFEACKDITIDNEEATEHLPVKQTSDEIETSVVNNENDISRLPEKTIIKMENNISTLPISMETGSVEIKDQTISVKINKPLSFINKDEGVIMKEINESNPSEKDQTDDLTVKASLLNENTRRTPRKLVVFDMCKKSPTKFQIKKPFTEITAAKTPVIVEQNPPDLSFAMNSQRDTACIVLKNENKFIEKSGQDDIEEIELSHLSSEEITSRDINLEQSILCQVNEEPTQSQLSTPVRTTSSKNTKLDGSNSKKAKESESDDISLTKNAKTSLQESPNKSNMVLKKPAYSKKSPSSSRASCAEKSPVKNKQSTDSLRSSSGRLIKKKKFD